VFSNTTLFLLFIRLGAGFSVIPFCHFMAMTAFLF
jgi:hypothetical protein